MPFYTSTDINKCTGLEAEFLQSLGWKVEPFRISGIEPVEFSEPVNRFSVPRIIDKRFLEKQQ